MIRKLLVKRINTDLGEVPRGGYIGQPRRSSLTRSTSSNNHGNYVELTREFDSVLSGPAETTLEVHRGSGPRFILERTAMDSAGLRDPSYDKRFEGTPQDLSILQLAQVALEVHRHAVAA